jgi:hypothetical protein
MIYLPKSLYLKSVRAAKTKQVSLSALMRVALNDFLEKPKGGDFQQALNEAFGIWKDRKDMGSSSEYVQKLRKGWSTRARRLGL